MATLPLTLPFVLGFIPPPVDVEASGVLTVQPDFRDYLIDGASPRTIHVDVFGRELTVAATSARTIEIDAEGRTLE